ncbi:MAG: flavodoxin family protein [Lachnospiraceae bacterium]|jgi:multimeric flavodoxin WrbA
MKILVIKSSGHLHGSSNMLADEFIRGARENGHEVSEYDVFRVRIKPCAGCNRCGMNGDCAMRDDFSGELRGRILAADMLVFAFPVYYYGWPAQTKAVIDRFYSCNMQLQAMHKKTAMLTVAMDDTDTVFDAVNLYYKMLCSYLNFTDLGSVCGRGCGTPSQTQRSGYPEKAYALGKSII